MFAFIYYRKFMLLLCMAEQTKDVIVRHWLSWVSCIALYVISLQWDYLLTINEVCERSSKKMGYKFLQCGVVEFVARGAVLHMPRFSVGLINFETSANWIFSQRESYRFWVFLTMLQAKYLYRFSLLMSWKPS